MALYILCLFLHLPVTVMADEFERGNQALSAGSFAEAYRIWWPEAQAGDARAQFGIASLYDRGQGVEVNYFLSANWFERAAMQGLAIAQFNLGNAYHHGRGVAQDDHEAMRLWLLAAEQGLPSAEYNLGTQYLLGQGVKQDEVEARRWYQRAAKNGHPGARRFLSGVHQPLEVTASVPAATPRAQSLAASPAPVTVPLAESGGVTHSKSGTDLFSADWMLQQNPQHLTLQLAVMSEEIRVLLFIRKNQISGLLSYFPIKRNGRTLFVLTSGLYVDRPSAVEAVMKLPKSVQMARPWIRQLGAIQDQIKASKLEE
jgi:hypothetical protein